MRTWAKGSRPAALLAVGVMALGGNGAALADTSGDHSIGGGNQVNLPITLPVDISGNAVGVAGEAEGQSRGGAVAVGGGGSGAGGNRTSGRSSVLGGNQIVAPITAPINACGNAVAVLGESEADCKGGAKAVSGGRGGSGAGGNRTSGRSSVLGGNQVVAPITAPINACGNAVAIFGEAVAGCKGGAKAVTGGGRGAGGNRTSGTSSVLGGNQVVAPITVPINVCGNSVAAFGQAFSGCTGGAAAGNGHPHGHEHGKGKPGKPGKYGKHGKGKHGHGHGYGGRPLGSGGNDTDGRFAAGAGNQVVLPITAPINLCGNAVGDAAAAACKGGAAVVGGGGRGAGGNRTSGRSSVLGGNQVVAPITAPINVCGNALAIDGRAFAGCKGGAAVVGGGGRGAGGNRTDGRSSVLGGNQVVAPITAPINVCGNAAAVLGQAEAACKGGAKVVGGAGRGAGGNRTSGASSVLGGNQVVAPITAPVNVCGNAVAVLGDAAAGCLGSAKVGGPHGHGYWKASVVHQSGGLMSVVPVVPAAGGTSARTVDAGRPKLPTGVVPAVSDATNPLGLPAALPQGLPKAPLAGEVLPVAGGVPQEPGRLPSIPGGLAELPNLPAVSGLPASALLSAGAPAAVESPKGGSKAGAGKGARGKGQEVARPVAPKAEAGQAGPLQPVTDLVGGTPVGSAAGALPLGNIGLMSAEQPGGVTGMNAGSLLALALGTLFAASATLFALTRRLRPGRK
ncbi:chaplin family protein [Thermopolyspora sp. NPDC052614]|uniref:chaplin family protein n=1 Tax=Thermopolyspora sp. NPDC052614 TaxID=3155682 RepID=UPI00342261A8